MDWRRRQRTQERTQRADLGRPLNRDTEDDDSECSCSSPQVWFIGIVVLLLLGTAGAFAVLWRVAVGQMTDPGDLTVRRALTGFFYATNPSGASWTRCDDDSDDGNPRWGSQQHYCEWQCIVCSPQRTVTALDMSGAGLSGSLPSLIGAISSLERLNISDNPSLAGTLPTSLGGLVNLTTLTFSSTAVSGSLPASLKDLVKLSTIIAKHARIQGYLPYLQINVLDLQNNDLSGTLGVWPAQSVLLQDNYLSGSLPTASPPSLNMEVSYNRLSGTLPASLGSVGGLLTIKADCADDYALDPALAAAARGGEEAPTTTSSPRRTQPPQQLVEGGGVAASSAATSCISGTIPAQLGELTQLTHLELARDRLSGTIPPQLAQLSHLQFFKLESNLLSGELPPALEATMRRLAGDTCDVSNNCLSFDGQPLCSTGQHHNCSR